VIFRKLWKCAKWTFSV